jgi:hypothetical protein
MVRGHKTLPQHFNSALSTRHCQEIGVNAIMPLAFSTDSATGNEKHGIRRNKSCQHDQSPSVVSLASEEMHVALHVSHAALPMLSSKFHSNAALTMFDTISLYYSPTNVIKIPIICITSTRKTSGNNLETFNTDDIQCPPLHVLSLSILSIYFSYILSLSFPKTNSA